MKHLITIFAVCAITARCFGTVTNSEVEAGTVLLDDCTSRSRVVWDAYLNSSNRVDALIRMIVPEIAPGGDADFTTNNHVLVSTIETVAPVPGNYLTVSNLAMTAIQTNTLRDILYDYPDKDYVDTKFGIIDQQISVLWGSIPSIDGLVNSNDVCNIVTNTVAIGYESFSNWRVEQSVSFLEFTRADFSNGVWNAYCYWTDTLEQFTLVANGTPDDLLVVFNDFMLTIARQGYGEITQNSLGLARLVDLPPLTNGLASTSITNGFITDAYISTNNAAFVTAVTNCPVAIAASDAEALAEWGIYGGGGTIGALLAALAAAVAALKRGKVTTISAQSTDEQYPSAKCVWDIVGNVEAALAAINGTAQTSQSGNGGSGT